MNQKCMSFFPCVKGREEGGELMSIYEIHTPHIRPAIPQFIFLEGKSSYDTHLKEKEGNWIKTKLPILSLCSSFCNRCRTVCSSSCKYALFLIQHMKEVVWLCTTLEEAKISQLIPSFPFVRLLLSLLMYNITRRCNIILAKSEYKLPFVETYCTVHSTDTACMHCKPTPSADKRAQETGRCNTIPCIL